MTHPCVALEECCEFLDHIRRPVKESERVNGPYPYFGANGQQGWINDYLFDEPLVLLAEDGGHFSNPERGIAYKIIGKTWVNNHAHVLRPREGIIDVDYLAHALKNKDVRRHLSGSTRDKLTKAGACQIEIPLPTLEEQRRIAAILDKAQDLSLRARLSNELASSLIESEMIQRFGHPGRVQPQSGLLTLVDAGVTVIDCPHSTPQWTEDGKICLRTSNLGKGNWIWQDTRHISDDDFLERSRRAPVETGDIVLSREGTIGIAAIVTSDMEVCMGQRLVQLKLDTSRLMPEYLLAQLLYLLKPERISHAMTGSTSKHINVKDLRELKVHCPPIEEHLDFENFCESAKKLRSRICILGQKSDVLSRSIHMTSV